MWGPVAPGTGARPATTQQVQSAHAAPVQCTCLTHVPGRMQVGVSINFVSMRHRCHAYCAFLALDHLATDQTGKHGHLDRRHELRARERPQNSSRQHVVMFASLLPFAALAVTQQQAAPQVVAAAAPHLPAMMSSVGLLVLCCAAAVLMLSAIPLLWSLARAANRMESMLQVRPGVISECCYRAACAVAGVELCIIMHSG